MFLAIGAVWVLADVVPFVGKTELAVLLAEGFFGGRKLEGFGAGRSDGR